MSSAASATCMPSEAARFNAPDRPPESTSAVLMPALASSLIAFADSVALNTVLLPASNAAFFNDSSSSPVAPVLALTSLIASSKSANILTALTPNARLMAPTAMPALVAAVSNWRARLVGLTMVVASLSVCAAAVCIFAE